MTVYNFGLDLSDVGCLKNGVGLLKMEALWWHQTKTCKGNKFITLAH
jgi:hypothetical protein